MNSSRGTAVKVTGRSGIVSLPRRLTEWDALDPYDFRLAVWLSSHSAEYVERVTQRGIARRLGMSQERVKRSLDRLAELGIVAVEPAPHGLPLTIDFMVEVWESSNHEAEVEGARQTGTPARQTGSGCSPDGHQEKKERTTTSSTRVTDSQRSIIDAAFNGFWSLYPRKKEKKNALKAYERAVLDAPVGQRQERIREIMAGAMRYARESSGKEERFVKHPATWLNGGCWDDEPDRAADPNDFPEEI